MSEKSTREHVETYLKAGGKITVLPDGLTKDALAECRCGCDGNLFRHSVNSGAGDIKKMNPRGRKKK